MDSFMMSLPIQEMKSLSLCSGLFVCPSKILKFSFFGCSMFLTKFTPKMLWVLSLLQWMESFLLHLLTQCCMYIRDTLGSVSCSVMPLTLLRPGSVPSFPPSPNPLSLPPWQSASAWCEFWVVRNFSYSVLFPSCWHKAWHAVNPFNKCCSIKLMRETVNFTFPIGWQPRPTNARSRI